MNLHSRRPLFIPFFLVLSFLLFVSTRASAQIFPGRITGTVTDSQGAAVPGATVKLTNPSTGFERVAVSGENGDFNFAELALGTYQLTVSKENFKTAVLTGITTALGQVNTIDPVLTVGSATSEIQVTTAPLLLQTETNSAGGQLSEQQIANLPLGNSDYTRLALVLPGSTQNCSWVLAPLYSVSYSTSDFIRMAKYPDVEPPSMVPHWKIRLGWLVGICMSKRGRQTAAPLASSR